MKILYIAGLAHSGSTYLARVLNQHTEIFSAGELEFLHGKIEGGFSTCSCTSDSTGDIKEGCEFWAELMDPLLNKIDVEGTSRVSLKRNMEWFQAIYQDKISGIDSDFERGNRLLFERISDFTDSPVVIDASKGPWRLIPLKRIFGENLYVLHILKHPLNQLVSRVNRNQNFYRMAIMKYVRRNIIYSWKFGGESTYHRVRFEEFIEDPGSHLADIFESLDLEYEDPFEKEQQLYHHLSGSDAKVSKELPQPNPDRVDKDEPDWSFFRKGIVRLLEKLY